MSLWMEYEKRFIKITTVSWFFFIIQSMEVGDLGRLGVSAVFRVVEEKKWKTEDVILHRQAMVERIAEENQQRQKDATERAAVWTSGQKGNAEKQRGKENVQRMHQFRIIVRRHAKYATKEIWIKNWIETPFFIYICIKLIILKSIQSSDKRIQHGHLVILKQD